MDEREQIEKASLNKVMLQRTSEISSQNPRRKGGDKKKSSKGQMESQDGLHLGLKEQKNTFRDQEKGGAEGTASVRGKTQE